MDVSKGRYWQRAWSLVDGCSPCSPGCDNCWSAVLWHRFHQGDEFSAEEGFTGRAYLTRSNGPEFTGRIITRPDRLDVPLRTPKSTVFAVWNDLFHEDVPDEFIALAWEAMWNVGLHTYLILTKRPKRMAEFYKKYHGYFSFVDHVWLGVTVCNQAEADEKIPLLLQIPAAHRWIAIEPMLGEINLNTLTGNYSDDKDRNVRSFEGYIDRIDAVVLGGETGPRARPLHPDWVRSVRDQCQSAGVPFFFKGWGRWGLNWFIDNDGNKIEGSDWMDKTIKNTGRLLDSRTHDELPWRSDVL